ncbi:putative dehydrogenase [Caulobacter sp. AP07]|uniref:oxidoreductase n=1 Tax=Caulobacter sp. AP07 TaxID=1144304 RepID=UPI000271E919|nr:oxidoreductase [Caulobacter sp. AP07]EJL25999.1 putative dehydrogenase [Caulobacter sp. AP07]
MSSPLPIHVALVGYGFVGKTFHAPLIVATPGLVLHTVVSSDPVKVLADHPVAKIVPDLAAALADPAVDLVVIATPDPLHAPQAHAALDAGKAVVIDKPFAVTLEEARSVADHAARAGKLLSIFHNRRWDSDFLTLKALISDGSLGEIVQYESHFDRFRPVVRDRWREAPGAGALLDLGPHLIDQALQLFGPPTSVFADLAIQKDGGQAPDYFHLLLRYPRLRVLLHASQMTVASDLRMAVHGTRGSFVKQGLDPQENALKAGIIPGSQGWGVDPRPGTLTVPDGEGAASRVVAGAPGDYLAYYAGVRDALLGHGENPAPPQEALAVMELIDLAARSAAEGRELSL